LAQPEVLTKLHDRFANLGEPQQAGHYFEWQQELTFNLDAIAKAADVRAGVTEWLGEPHAAADLRLFDPSGHVISEVQTKVVTSTAQRLSPVDGLAAEKYDSMQLVVPSDHLAPAQALLDRRLDLPSGPLHEHYRDVQERLLDHTSYGDVSSEPITDEDLRRVVVHDPSAYVDGLAAHDHVMQLLHASGAGGLTAGVVTATATLAVSAVRSGSLNGLPWMEAGLHAARASARTVAVTIGGQSTSLAAQHTVAHGAASAAGHALAGGTLAFALARGSLDIAIAAHGFATGRLTAGQASEATARAITRGAAVWACAAVGQAIIPVPFVGALVGGVVGQVGAAMVVKGIQLAVMARDQKAEWDAAYQLLIQRTGEIQAAAKAEIDQLTQQQQSNDTAFANIIIPLLANIADTMGSGRPDQVLDALAQMTRHYAGTPLFASMTEFDAFMVDEHTALTLDLGSGL
jgi:hypothetical protein